MYICHKIRDCKAEVGTSAVKSGVREPAMSASPGSFLETQTLKPHPYYPGASVSTRAHYFLGNTSANHDPWCIFVSYRVKRRALGFLYSHCLLKKTMILWWGPAVSSVHRLPPFMLLDRPFHCVPLPRHPQFLGENKTWYLRGIFMYSGVTGIFDNICNHCTSFPLMWLPIKSPFDSWDTDKRKHKCLKYVLFSMGA